jgi:hypothetical protein
MAADLRVRDLKLFGIGWIFVVGILLYMVFFHKEQAT